MNKNFWQARWQKNKIDFHKSEANPLLLEHFEQLGLATGKRVFLPLCGKTRDIGWLLINGYQVVGAELVVDAVDQLFAELEIEPEISEAGDLLHYSANNLDLFAGDIFELTGDLLGPVDAVYDRAALVALKKKQRREYTSHLMNITHTAPQLLIVFDYDQTQMKGPPFSISDKEIKQHYAQSYDLKLIKSTSVDGGIRGKYPADEKVWLLASQ